MAFFPLVVIGGSAGAMAPLRQIVSGFPSEFAASVLVVLHLSPAHPSILADILDRSGPLPARETQDGDPLRPGEILVAPADHHLLTGQDSVQVTQGAVENRSRPSIDVLFRSAARTHGTSVIGVVLSGLLGDGAAGLAAIKQAAVQCPGAEGSRQRLLQEGQQRVDVPADVGGVHLEQHAQEMHRKRMSEIDQGEQQAVRNIQLELPAGPEAALPSLPQEGRAVRLGPQGLELFSEDAELTGVQAAERLEGPGTLHEARHLKHAVTLPNSPQLRNGS